MLAMSSLSWTRIAVILLSVPITLLLLRNNQIPFHQSLNFILFLLNHSGSGTILFVITAYSFCAIVGTSATNISSVVSISVTSIKASFSVILSNCQAWFTPEVKVYKMGLEICGLVE